ncbi:MAG: hypothetical protein J4F28_01135 [Nitrosopumilaceae archaeon]|nr:hypothetical protein [Nitrosopumilaceae archaeon]
MAASGIQPAAGHGTSSETFPPVELNGRQVALEISSSAPPPPETTGRPPAGIVPGEDLQIGVALVDFDSKVTLRDVTFYIRAELGNKFLFEREFRADNGFLVFNFASDDSAGDEITVRDGGEGGDQYDIVSYLLGVESRNVRVSGPSLADGGLYKFDISIVTAGDYSERLASPIGYDSGISIPMITTYGVKDPNFGDQYIRVITYYDKIAGFEYDSKTREIRYSMPFEWSDSNIDQSYVVHEELSIPDTYGDLLLSGFELYINDVRLPEETVLIDDFFTGERIVHFIVPQEQLYSIRDGGGGQEDDIMNFVIRPDTNHTRIASVTENGQFRIFASWEPEELRSGQNARIIFEVTDVFLKGAPIAAEYHFSVTTEDGSTIFEQSGVSTDSRDDPTNVAEFEMPQGVSGIAYLNFERLQGNERARTSMPIVIDRVSGGAVIDDGTIGVTAGANGAGETSYNEEEGGGCLIATAAYGSELAPQVQQLRELRDNTILRTAYGTAFMSGFNSIYYTFSPAVADLQREHQTLRDMTRIALTPMLVSLMLLDGTSIGTEYDMLAYGISIIALNGAVYVALPVAVTVIACERLKRWRDDRLPDTSMRVVERRQHVNHRSVTHM